jgi:hypothetical protein
LVLLGEFVDSQLIERKRQCRVVFLFLGRGAWGVFVCLVGWLFSRFLSLFPACLLARAGVVGWVVDMMGCRDVSQVKKEIDKYLSHQLSK